MCRGPGGVQMGEGAWDLRTERQRGVRRIVYVTLCNSTKLKFLVTSSMNLGKQILVIKLGEVKLFNLRKIM